MTTKKKGRSSTRNKSSPDERVSSESDRSVISEMIDSMDKTIKSISTFKREKYESLSEL